MSSPIDAQYHEMLVFGIDVPETVEILESETQDILWTININVTRWVCRLYLLYTKLSIIKNEQNWLEN